MTLREQLLHVTNIYCRHSERSETRVATLIFSGGMRIQKIREGGDLGTMAFESAMQWFSDNWPESAEWPSDVPRPVRAEEVAA